MTNAPVDLLGFRDKVRASTGLSAIEVGIVGDPAHARTGGYHIGKSGLRAAGVWETDYSVRLTRDRNGCTENASATDIGANWPKGGVAAWKRFCKALLSELKSNGSLSAVRAINADAGAGMHRYDREYGWAQQSTSDTGHIHIEFYRDTEGERAGALAILASLVASAVNGAPTGGTPTTTDGDDMFCKKGDKNDKVLALQAMLAGFGFNVGPLDGDYGDQTSAAVRAALNYPSGNIDPSNSGASYGPWEYAAIMTRVVHGGGGQKGDKGDKGDPGKDGAPGPKGDPGAAAVLPVGATLRIEAS